MLSEATRPGKG
jgi:hypothetical protein